MIGDIYSKMLFPYLYSQKLKTVMNLCLISFAFLYFTLVTIYPGCGYFYTLSLMVKSK